MKNQMMNLLHPILFIIFRAIITARTVSAAKNPLRPKGFRSFGNVKENAEPVFAIAADTGFLFPDALKRMHEAVPPAFRLRYQPNTGISIFQSVFIKQTQPKPVI